MDRHPLNLLLRFALEVAALVVLGRWGWGLLPGWHGAIPGLLVPVAAGAVWGIFRVPDDGGRPVVSVSGPVRLLLEVAFFTAAVWAAYATGDGRWAAPLGTLVSIHYALSWRRVDRLARNQPLPASFPQGRPRA